ncbi:lasso peptide biosynthesis PqqD family chaperone [Streptomyces sp. NPDC012935]|uniref:lasso peptide biosynthesis PqqD family chaperone n=1 Tax=Streptomyces sp. NPDC012935 TaxID=3364857 RepID=UPI00368F892B
MPLRLHPDVTMAVTDDGAVLLHQRTGRYWQLNNTGVLVLRGLLDGDSPEQTADALVDRHRADLADARRDVSALVDGLRAAQLLREV